MFTCVFHWFTSGAVNAAKTLVTAADSMAEWKWLKVPGARARRGGRGKRREDTMRGIGGGRRKEHYI